MPRHHSRDTVNPVLALLDAKSSLAQIHKDTGVPIPTIGRLCSKYCPNRQKATAGRPPKPNPTAACCAACLYTNRKSVSMREVTTTLSKLTGEFLHPKAVRHALMRRARRKIAEEHKHWTL
ncbi:hypothetical protein OPQ81_000430 [Rhizoctonia solani]|nr:hypothetical protein OPQ81_000430 [Rhizoctonia solani]